MARRPGADIRVRQNALLPAGDKHGSVVSDQPGLR